MSTFMSEKRMRIRRMGATVLIVAGVSIVASVSEVRAATFTVDSTDDTPDATPGDGVCADASGACSLRAAVGEANALAGADVIDVPAGTYDYGFPLSVRDDVTIRGAGAGSTFFRGTSSGDTIAIANEPSALVVSGVTLRGVNDCIVVFGSAVGSSVTVNDTVFDNCGDAGILVDLAGPVTIDVAGSQFLDTGASARGILIRSEGGTLTVTDSLASSLRQGFTAIFGDGFGTVSVADSQLIGISGTALSASGGEVGVDVARSHFDSNGSGTDLMGTTTIIDTLFTDNDIGVFWSDIAAGSLQVASSTVSGGFDGIVVQNNSGRDVVVTNSTVSGVERGVTGTGVSFVNSTIVHQGIVDPDGYGVSSGGTTATFLNTIVDVDGADDCGLGTVVSSGGNVDGDGTCGFGDATDLSSTDPLLGPLADNGGATPTHLPEAASPVIDSAVAAGCPGADQRAIARPQGAGCDRGAVELEAVVPPTTVPPTTVPPTTVPPTTVPPTTVPPTTVAPTTVAPTTIAPVAILPPTGAAANWSAVLATTFVLCGLGLLATARRAPRST